MGSASGDQLHIDRLESIEILIRENGKNYRDREDNG